VRCRFAAPMPSPPLGLGIGCEYFVMFTSKRLVERCRRIAPVR